MKPDALRISDEISIPLSEIELTAIRARGAGGQNVNKVSTAVHLRFDIGTSSLPEAARQALLEYRDKRISGEGVVVIKAQRFRSQEKNRNDALDRLQSLLETALQPRKERKPTRPTRASREKRLEDKSRRGRLKSTRGRVTSEEY